MKCSASEKTQEFVANRPPLPSYLTPCPGEPDESRLISFSRRAVEFLNSEVAVRLKNCAPRLINSRMLLGSPTLIAPTPTAFPAALPSVMILSTAC
jgi:hypothetical protein